MFDEALDTLIKNGFKTSAGMSRSLDVDVKNRIKLRMENCNIFPCPYFYVRGRARGSGGEILFTATDVISSLMLFRNNMPRMFIENGTVHHLKVNFMLNLFKDEITGVPEELCPRYHIFMDRSVSLLVEMFRFGLEGAHDLSARGTGSFLDYSEHELGLEVVFPYGKKDVKIWMMDRDHVKTFATGFSMLNDFAPKYGNKRLPVRVMDTHDALKVVVEYGCPTCNQSGKQLCTDPLHIQVVPLVEECDRVVAVFTIDTHKSKVTGSITGTKDIISH